MAKRYYTEEAKEQIKRIILEIENEDVDPVVEFFSDLFQRIGQFLELYSVDDYKDDMQKWYTKVLDSHNSTFAEVESIMEDAIGVDFEYRDLMINALDSITNFQKTLNTLRDVISGKTSLEDGQTAADKFIADGKRKLNGACDTILTKVEQKTLWDASKALFGDALKIGAGYIKCKSGGNAADYKSFVDTCVATGCDLLAMGAIVIAPIGALGDALDGHMDMSYEDYLDVRFQLLTMSSNIKDVNSVSDLLGNLAEDMDEQLAKCPEDSPYYSTVEALTSGTKVLSKTSEAVDIVADAYGIYTDAKDTVTNISEFWTGRYYTSAEYDKYFDEFDNIKGLRMGEKGLEYKADLTAGEFIQKVVSNWTGLPTTGWTDPSKFDGNVFKTAGTLWSYGEKLLPDPMDGQPKNGELPDAFFGNYKNTKLLKDIFDFARDVKELAIPDSSIVLPGVADNTTAV